MENVRKPNPMELLEMSPVIAAVKGVDGMKKCFESECQTAVSYTHLDVYKRQPRR